MAKYTYTPKDMEAWKRIAAKLVKSPAPQGSPEPDPVQVAPDPGYIAATTANQNRYDTLHNQYAPSVQAAAAEYGYQTTVNPDDTYAIGGIDTTNPYSRAALLQRSYESQQRGNTNSYASRGLQFSGALQNAQNHAADNYQASSSALQRSFSDLLRGYYNSLQNAAADTTVANAQAFGAIPPPVAPTTVTYAGVPYLPADHPGGYATPVGAPTYASVQASKSLIGTGLDRNSLKKRKAR